MTESTNFRFPRTSFHGRERLLELCDDVVGEGHRLITILGPPGVGKTRLAKQYLARRFPATADSYPGGLWLVDLSEARSASDLLTLTAEALAVPVSSDQSQAETESDRIGWAIAGRGAALIVFDNFEHLVTSCRQILDRWLSQADEAVFLVTSRHRLNLRDEVLVEVGPMDLPSSDCDDTASLRAVESVALFLDRAHLVRPSWQISDSELAVVGRIVRRLDGLPLAIELAAARSDVIGPAELDRRLDQRFELLSQASPLGADRRASLTASIQWSWNQLEEWERTALRQLTVFKGGFTASSAEAVVDLGRYTGAPGFLDILRSLKAKSLVSTGSAPSQVDALRFTLLESIREFSVEQPDDDNERRRAAERHAAYYARKGFEWARAIISFGDLDTSRRLASERANLRAVFSRASAESRQAPDTPLSIPVPQLLSVALALAPIFHPSVTLSAYDDVIDSVRDHLFDELAGEEETLTLIRYAVAEIYRLRERIDHSEQMFRLALQSAQRSGEPHLLGLAKLGIARVLWERLSCDESIETVQEALTHLEDDREPALVAAGLRNIAMAHSYRWRPQEATPLWESALATANRWGVLGEELRILILFGRDLWMNKDFKQLKRLAARARDVSEALGDPWLEANRLMSFAYLLAEPGSDVGDLVKALTYFKGFGSHVSATTCALACGFLSLDGGLREMAEEYLRQARTLTERYEPPIWVDGECTSLEAAIRWDEGDLEQACLLFTTAVESSRQSGHIIFEVVWLSQLAAVQTLRQNLTEAASCYEAARAILDSYELPVLRDLYTLHTVFRDVALTQQARDDNDEERAERYLHRGLSHLAEVLDTWSPELDAVWHPQSSAFYSPDIRLAARKLELLLVPADRRRLLLRRLDPGQDALVVEATGRWFLAPGEGERAIVDLRSRSKLHLLLSSLAGAWRPDLPNAAPNPHTTLSEEDIAAVLWPDQTLLPSSVRARVQVAISTLRKLGLRKLLLRNRDGYFLDPAVPVMHLTTDLPSTPHLQVG